MRLHLIAIFSACDGSAISDGMAVEHLIESTPNLTRHDAKRNKDLPVRVTWTDAAGMFPVIIRSHGAYSSKDAYLPLVEYWARRNYVMIQPTHEDSITLGQKAGGKRLLWVEGMDHGFGDVSGLQDGIVKFQSNADHIRYTKVVTLAFWDAPLKGDAQSKAWPVSDTLASFSHGIARIEHK